MPDPIGIIALDLDGTLLTSEKTLSSGNLAALQRAAEMGIEIVPSTGRFFSGMPQFLRDLPFIRYAITINGAYVLDRQQDAAVYRADIPWQQAVDIMAFLDTLPVVYDCYLDNTGWITAEHKVRADSIIHNPHYLKMVRDLRRDVPELKDFLAQRQTDVQKVQLFTDDSQLRLRLLQQLSRQFDGLSVSSATDQNVEINSLHANKGEALLALARHLGIGEKQTMAFGDGLNDLSMIRAAGIGVAMANGEEEVKAQADYVTLSNDVDGVAAAIEQFCFRQL